MVELLQGPRKQRPIRLFGCRMMEQGQAGSKLEIVRRSENLKSRSILVVEDQPYVMTQPPPKGGVSKVSSRLIQIRYGVVLRRGATAQADKLRKDEPHPVRALAAGSQLFCDLGMNRGLRLYEACEIRIGYGRDLLQFCWLRSIWPSDSP